MMNEVTYVIVAGLFLQLIGALVIINPKYFWQNRKEFKKRMEKFTRDMAERKKKQQANIYSDIEELGKTILDEKEKFVASQWAEILKPNRIIFGIILLIVGFILQAIGELYR